MARGSLQMYVLRILRRKDYPRFSRCSHKLSDNREARSNTVVRDVTVTVRATMLGPGPLPLTGKLPIDPKE
jgi:hypothetical protein